MGDPSAPERRREAPLTTAAVRAGYRRPPSFTDFLPWVEYLPESRAFLLEDGVSVGALFELTPIGTEARTEAYLTELRDAVRIAIAEAIPERDEAPWIVQFYVQDEPSLAPLLRDIAAYLPERTRALPATQAYLATLAAHCARISRPEGLFRDETVTGSVWRGQVRRVRATLYRRLGGRELRAGRGLPETELNEVATKWCAALAAAGIAVRRAGGADLYRWLLPWFNPSAPGIGTDPERLLAEMPYPGDAELPYGADLAAALTLSMPRSDDSGRWWFDGLPHTVVSIEGLRRVPGIGHLTAERDLGEQSFALFDRLPGDCVLALTITVAPQDRMRQHVGLIRRAAVGDSADAALTREAAVAVEREMASGNKLYPCAIALYLRGRDPAALDAAVDQLSAVLLPSGVQPIGREADLLAKDSYLRNLPMAYDARFERVRRRSRLIFTRHLANLVPVYGRARGTAHPGLVFFNRGAEPLVFDPLHPADRKKNAHMLILGPTGAGKSALLVSLLQQMVAVHQPRIFIIEAGGSFTLLGQHFARLGLSVNQITLNPTSDVRLPPFADALRLLDRDRRAPRPADLPGDLDDAPEVDEPDEEEGARDLLGEMEIAARIMITGGDEREDARLTRADRLLIRNAILAAATAVSKSGGAQVQTHDVVAALRAFGADVTLPEHRRHRAIEMSDGLELFCSGVAGRFFDRPGTPWPAADVTILEMGLLAREGYEDQLAIAYLSMMSHINDLVERHQSDARPTLVVTDEGHIITTNPLLARYVVKITKMWRKLGAWFWIATQNLEDFPDASRRMLNMMEWWLCLVMPKEEIEQIARFKDLNDERRSLLRSARKEPSKYVEGVVLSDTIEALFRHVPPPLTLALAMTEQHEKAERATIMRERNCTELEAAYVVAERIGAG